MEYLLWGLYAFMVVFCLKSLFTLIEQHKTRHQYKVVLEAREELAKQAESTAESTDEEPNQQAA